MTQILKNAILIDPPKQEHTLVSLNGLTKAYDLFPAIGINLNETDIAIHATDEQGLKNYGMLVNGPIEEERLIKLKALSAEEVESINSELNELSNPAKISEHTKNYIIITFEKLDNVDLSEILKVLYKSTTYKPTKSFV